MAQAILTAAGLRLGRVTLQDHPQVGLVVGQALLAGERVAKDTTVDLVVRCRQVTKRTEVPNVVRLALAAAREKLAAAGLTVGTAVSLRLQRRIVGPGFIREGTESPDD